MSEHPWMPLYVADYLADTSHLCAAEHGAYMLLIMHYWMNGNLPDNDVHLSRIARMSTKEWSAHKATIAALFQPGWLHKRIDRELQRANDISDRRSTAGRTAGKASAAARQRIVNESSTPEQPKPNPLQSQSQEQAAQQSAPEIEKADRAEVELRSAAGERAPPADFDAILALIDKGYDLVKDIIPVVRDRAGKATKAIGSWRYFVPAIEEAKAANRAIKPKANGTPAEPVTWLPAESPLWAAMAERWQHAKGKELYAAGSSHAPGLGAFIPAAWIEFAQSDLTGSVN